MSKWEAMLHKRREQAMTGRNLEIYEAIMRGESPLDLSAKYGVTRQRIYQIVQMISYYQSHPRRSIAAYKRRRRTQTQ